MPTFDEIWRTADELRDVLPIFTLAEQERRQIVSQMRVRRFRAHEVIYHQDDAAVDAFVVHRGLVKSLVRDRDGRELLIALHGRGQFFGELALFQHDPAREASAAAATPTTVLQIPRQDALRVLEHNPRAILFMARRMAELNLRLARLAAGLIFMDAAGRVAFVLIEIERIRARQPFALTQDELGAAAGAGRRTVSRVLADFAERGLVRVEPRTVRVLDDAGLRREIRTGYSADAAHDPFRRLDDVVIRDA